MRDPTKRFTSGPAIVIYNETRKWFTLGSLFLTPVLLIINAPFGRFTPKNQSSLWLVDGIKSWMFMELVSPATFLYTYVKSPLTIQQPPLPGVTSPVTVLALCFLLHYANRAVLSPLRTPSRSKTHIIVPLSGIIFNVINGSLMGAFLASPYARMYHEFRVRPSFYVGLAMWAAGLLGNIYHDEILLNIRRKAKSKGKARADGVAPGEHYAIPTGGLYMLISYPNYFCEWFEWLGFAIAASPIPLHLADIVPSAVVSLLLNPQTYIDILNTPAQNFVPNLTPPWIFFISEILLMIPRAYRGHQWYHHKFGDAYPRNRKAVIPFMF